MSNCTDIAAYTYRADVFCSACILPELTDHHGRLTRFVDHDNGTTETALDGMADALNVDRYDERSYDSGDFPKVVFGDQLRTDDDECGPDRCGRCGTVLP